MHIQERVLGNGLKVVVQSDHRAPVVVSQIWYKVGSADEPEGLTGLSHALEHMMFKGTPSVPNDGYSEQISKNGGYNNAFTTEDFTAYYVELAADKLPLSFQLEADRMANLSLKAEDFIQEKKVIMEERRMRVDDNPQHLTFEQYKAAANSTGPYHHPVIGWMRDIENMTIEDLRKWYKTYYRPDNAILIVVGAVEPEAVFKLAEKYFGAIKPGTEKIKTIDSAFEIKNKKYKEITVKAPATLPYLIMGFDTPVLNASLHSNIEPYALAVVSAALDGGDSARFSRNLIRGKNLAGGANTHYEPFKRYASQFDITGIPKEGVSIQALQAAFWDEINDLKNKPLTKQELDKIKSQLIADEVFQKDSMSQQATNIGDYEGVGLSWRDSIAFINRIKEVTPEDIQKVVRKYFTKDRLTVAILEPQAIS